jgi:hypothetical protein
MREPGQATWVKEPSTGDTPQARKATTLEMGAADAHGTTGSATGAGAGGTDASLPQCAPDTVMVTGIPSSVLNIAGPMTTQEPSAASGTGGFIVTGQVSAGVIEVTLASGNGTNPSNGTFQVSPPSITAGPTSNNPSLNFAIAGPSEITCLVTGTANAQSTADSSGATISGQISWIGTCATRGAYPSSLAGTQISGCINVTNEVEAGSED